MDMSSRIPDTAMDFQVIAAGTYMPHRVLNLVSLFFAKMIVGRGSNAKKFGAPGNKSLLKFSLALATALAASNPAVLSWSNDAEFSDLGAPMQQSYTEQSRIEWVEKTEKIRLHFSIPLHRLSLIIPSFLSQSENGRAHLFFKSICFGTFAPTSEQFRFIPILHLALSS